jgi:hypothetical protein
MVIRLTAFHESFRSGQIPVRWLSRLNHEYGYPVTNFLYPLPFYLAEPFYVLTGDPVIAVKTIMGLAVISMAFGSFVLFKKWGTSVGIVGALTYVYSPYIAYNLYTRGSLGELVALGIVPWVFWALFSKKLLLSSILTAALITAHNVVAVLFLPFIILYNIYNIYKTYKIHWGLSLILALGASAFFWLPALAEYRFVRASQISVSDFGNEYLSLQNAFQRTGPISVLTNLGLPMFFLTENSKWFWDLFNPLQIIQFPWRLLSLFSFSSATVASLVFKKLSTIKPFYLSICLFVYLSIILISVSPFLSPKSFFNYPSSYYQTNDDSTTVRSEYTPVWVYNLPLVRPETPIKHYYPGLKLFVNGSERFIWSETPLRATADLISIFSFFIILSLFKYRRVL